MDIKTKFEAFFILMLLLLAGGISVYALTRTITDTDDTVETYIRNSNGNYWEATAGNLQLAIYDLDNASGWVNGGNNLISISSPILLTNNLEIYNVRLFLDNDANVSMMQSYGTFASTWTYNIYIHDVYIDGNCMNQPATYYAAGGYLHHKCGIRLEYVDTARVRNVNITDPKTIGVFCYYAKNITISDTIVTGAGRRLENDDALGYESSGFNFWNAQHIQVSNCKSYNHYSVGFLFETGVGTAESVWTRNFTVSNCISYDGCNGYYLECAKDGVFSGCIAINNTDTTLYLGSYGFKATSDTKNILFSGCEATFNGVYSGGIGTALPANFYIVGIDNTLVGCVSRESFGYGYYLGEYNLLEGCRSIDDTSTGMYVAMGRNTISGCTIDGSSIGIMIYDNSPTEDGIYCNIIGTTIQGTSSYGIANYISNVTISDCVFLDCTTNGIYTADPGGNNYLKVDNCRFDGTASYGIRSYTGGFQNCTFSDNTLSNLVSAIDLRSGWNNIIMGNLIFDCTTGITVGSTGDYEIIIGNNAIDCTTDIDSNGVNTVCEHNIGTVS